MKFGEGCWVWKLCLHSCFSSFCLLYRRVRVGLLLRGKVCPDLESIFGKDLFSEKNGAKKQVEELQAHIANETEIGIQVFVSTRNSYSCQLPVNVLPILGQFMGVNAVL